MLLQKVDGREEGKERNIDAIEKNASVGCFLYTPRLGIKPALLVMGQCSKQLSYTGQGRL